MKTIIAVALETLQMPIAERFLSELAELKIAEMPKSSRVAALCLQKRRELLIYNTESQLKIMPIPLSKAPSSKSIYKIETKSTFQNNLQMAA